jgi:PAS domain S-box-containing protein
MTHAAIASDLAGEALSSQIRGAFQEFTGTAERLEKAYGALLEQVTALDLELNETNARLSLSLQENRRIRNYLSNILMSIEKGIVVVDPTNQVTLWSGGAERLTGFTASEALGRRVDQLLGEDAARLFLALDGDEGDIRREGQVAQKDGCLLEAEFSGSVIRDDGGATQGALLLFDDISQRKWAEEQRRRSTAQAGLGEMAVTIAHEIRNALASIELLATVLAEEVGADARRSDLVQGIRAGVASVNTVLTNLLAFSRPIKPRLGALHLHEVIDEALSTAFYALKEKQIDLVKNYHPLPIHIHADRELLKQVFLNLILNAVQAMSAGGQLRILTRDAGARCEPVRGGSRTRDIPAATSKQEAGTSTRGNEFVEVSVSDTGCGIPQADVEKIFLPFVTSKAKGTGLGLAIVERILAQHRARVTLRSQVGLGTTFTILFPSRCEVVGGTPGGEKP